MTSMQPSGDETDRPWNDPGLSPGDRVESLMSRMTLREKVAQLYSVWVGTTAEGGVAPHQNDMVEAIDLDALIEQGLGQLTRSFGTNPVDPAVGAAALANAQRRIVAAGRFGIPAVAHEECLAGFTTWGATAYPVPLSWGATFNPELVGSMAARIGAGMRSVGVHQGLAPVLDVTRDPRWGRTEETIGEDPYLVGTIATAYVKGLESAGIVATLKHFAGYSASKAGRNLAPVSMGPREFADVILPPFEMAVRESGVRSVMHSYSSVDGVPSVANAELLTTLLRDTWGFDGTVVADYFGIGFLLSLHGLAADWGQAASLALRAGVDVELPSVKAYAEPLVAEVESGRLDEAFVDRSVRRVLLQKLELGLLDADWDPTPRGWSESDLDHPEAGRIDLDDEENRAIARSIAEQAVVLLSNDGVLPLDDSAGDVPARIAVVGPVGDDPMVMLGCYSFPSHVGVHHPELPLGVELPTILEAVRAEFPGAHVEFVPGCGVSDPDTGGFDAARRAADDADLVIAAFGDRAGLFGLGTSGEGCDAESLALPGVQSELLEILLDGATPVVALIVSGRPYALGTAPERARAIVQAFFPGEEGARAIAGVLSGRINPSGRLPVSVPAHPGAQPATYLAPKLAAKSAVSNIDPTARFAFGHGLGYGEFTWSGFAVDGAQPGEHAPASAVPTDGVVRLSLRVSNDGDRAGADVVQLYLHDPVASTVQPESRLVGYARVELQAAESATVEFAVPVELASFTGLGGARIVEPGALELRVSRSSARAEFAAAVEVTGEPRTVDHTRRLHCAVSVDRHELAVALGPQHG